jgi:hypothetical protein
LQGRLKIAEEELQKLKIKNIADAKLIKGLTMEKITLVTKVRDRDEELRGKAKLLEVRIWLSLNTSNIVAHFATEYARRSYVARLTA